MKTYLIGQEQKITLDQQGLGAGNTVKVTIVGEDGEYIADVKDAVCSYDETAEIYYKNVTIPETETAQYVRIYFTSNDVEIDDDYYPEDAYIDKATVVPDIEVVPYTYFNDFYLSARSRMDGSHQSILDSYLSDKKGIRDKILAAQGRLEMKLEMFIAPRTFTEKRDNYMEQLSQNFWQFVVSYPPIIELLEFKFKIGDRELVDIPEKMFTLNEQMGIIEFLPYPGEEGMGYYTYFISTVVGMGVALHTAGGYERIPNMFHVQYKAGLFAKNQDKAIKAVIREAICKRALRMIVSETDPKLIAGSRSESKDGVTATDSYVGDKLLDSWLKEENDLVWDLRTRFGKNVNVAVL